MSRSTSYLRDFPDLFIRLLDRRRAKELPLILDLRCNRRPAAGCKHSRTTARGKRASNVGVRSWVSP